MKQTPFSNRFIEKRVCFIVITPVNTGSLYKLFYQTWKDVADILGNLCYSLIEKLYMPVDAFSMKKVPVGIADEKIEKRMSQNAVG